MALIYGHPRKLIQRPRSELCSDLRQHLWLGVREALNFWCCVPEGGDETRGQFVGSGFQVGFQVVKCQVPIRISPEALPREVFSREGTGRCGQ